MVKYHFSPESPDEEFIGNMQALNGVGDEAFAAIAQLAFAHLAADPLSSDLSLSLSLLASQHSVKPALLQPAFVSFLIFLNGSTKYNVTPEQMRDDLTELGISEDRVAHICKVFSARSDDLYDVAVNQTLRVNELVDLEWSFGVASSCRDVKKAGSAFLRIKFVFDKGGRTQTVFTEMTLPQFYEFIHEMEKARAALASASNSN
jgi:hypothetical protein